MSDTEDVLGSDYEAESEEEELQLPVIVPESGIDDTVIEENIMDNIEDINVFNKNYNKIKETNKSQKVLSKYEKTKILSKRCEQLESGCLPLIPDYEKYHNVYDIAIEEFKQKKIPFILKRFISGKYEYWKLEDLIN
jgi:DNA-directed RNA polymerase subunit K/omega